MKNNKKQVILRLIRINNLIIKLNANTDNILSRSVKNSIYTASTNLLNYRHELRKRTEKTKIKRAYGNNDDYTRFL